MVASPVLTLPTAPHPSARKTIEDLSRQKITACYQCQKCTNGCPVVFAMDVVPHRIMHLLQLGLLDEALRSQTIWACASCQTCTTRCPNGIDVARVMEGLRKISQRQGKAAQKNIRLFNAEFLSSIRQYGRLYELGMITRYTIRSQGLLGFLKQTAMGLDMVMKGKLKVLPHSLRPNQEVRAIFQQANRKSTKE